MKRLMIIGLAVVVLRGYSQEQLVPAQLKQKTVITEPATLYKGFFRAGFSTFFGTVDKYFDGNGKKDYFPGNTWGSTVNVSVGFVYGITDRLQVAGGIPYEWTSATQSVRFEMLPTSISPTGTSSAIWKTKGSGIGDVDLSVKYQVLTETPRRPAFLAVVDVVIPTGEKNPTNVIDDRNYSPAAGSGELKVDLGVGMRKISYPFSYTVYVDYVYHAGGTKVLDPVAPPGSVSEKPFKSSDYVYLITSFNFHLNDWIAVQNELDFFQYMNNGTIDNKPIDFPTTLLEYNPRISFQIKQLRLVQGIVVPLWGKNASADISLNLLAQYTF